MTFARYATREIQASPAPGSRPGRPAVAAVPLLGALALLLAPALGAGPLARDPSGGTAVPAAAMPAPAPAPVAPPDPPAAPGAAGLGLLDAVRLMLANDPNLVLAEAHLLNARGAFSVQRGTFDTIVSASAGHVDSRTPELGFLAQRETMLTSTLSLSQELRSGLTFTPEVDLDSVTENAALSGVTSGPLAGIVNTGTVSFTLRQPLLRGRGSAAADAGERAARREAEAAALDLRYTTTQRILTVTDQYWTAVAARLGLDILRSNETSERQLLVTTRRLIAADITPAAEAVQLEADLAAAEAARIAGESALFKARQDLGREIGLAGAATATLAPPADAFPELAPLSLDTSAASRFVAGALRARADVQAARRRREEADILRLQAENALLPQLDLVLRPSYSGVMGGGGPLAYLAPLVNQIPGVSSSLSLTLTWPVRNDTAWGQLFEARATVQQNAALLDQLEKSVGTDVPSAADAVARSSQQLERARRSVELFTRAVANEERKLAAGSSTLLDVITQRNRLLTAEQTAVSAGLTLALALAQLRFVTGTLLAADGDRQSFDWQHLTTVPTAEEMTP
jgi:outer membrane protein